MYFRCMKDSPTTNNHLIIQRIWILLTDGRSNKTYKGILKKVTYVDKHFQPDIVQKKISIFSFHGIFVQLIENLYLESISCIDEFF